MPEAGEVTLVPKEKEYDVEWKMNFTSISEEDDTHYSSPYFFFEDESWCLLIWPNGYKCTGSTGYIDLSFSRKSYNGGSINLQITFSLKAVNGQKHFKKQYTKVLDFGSYLDSDRFLSRLDFEKTKSVFLSSGFLVVVCTLKRLNSTGSENVLGWTLDEIPVTCNTVTADCSYCKQTFDTDKLSSHEKKCRVKCPECSDVILLHNWDEHECQTTKAEGNIAKVCSYCNKSFNAGEISLHEKKCRIKCPDCSSIVFYEKWHNHECQISRTEGGTSISGTSEICHHDRILQEFKQIFQKQENCDVVLRVKGRDFKAHKLILAARSPVFASTFHNDMKEKKTGIVDINDCDPSIFPDFLCFLYSDGVVHNLSEENVFGLFIAADKYDVPDLRKICLEFLKKNISVEIFCETLTLALQHNDTELISLATDFFIRNAEEILVTIKWLSFAVENPMQSNELVIKLVASYNCSKS